MAELRRLPPPSPDDRDDGGDTPPYIYQGEVMPPSSRDMLAAWMERQVKEGKIDRQHLRALIPNPSAEIDPDAGRALFAGFGGVVGSLWRTVGAGVGAAMGAAMYDYLKGRVEEKRRQEDERRWGQGRGQ